MVKVVLWGFWAERATQQSQEDMTEADKAGSAAWLQQDELHDFRVWWERVGARSEEAYYQVKGTTPELETYCRMNALGMLDPTENQLADQQMDFFYESGEW